MGTVEHARAMTIGMRTRSVSSVIFGFWRIWWLSGEAQFALFCFIIRNEHVVLWWFYYLLQLCKITYMYCSRVREGYQVNALKIILMNEQTIKPTSNSACIIMWAHIFVPNVATRTNPVFQLSFYDHKNTKTQVWIKSDISNVNIAGKMNCLTTSTVLPVYRDIMYYLDESGTVRLHLIAFTLVLTLTRSTSSMGGPQCL